MLIYRRLFSSPDDAIALGFIVLVFVPLLLMDLVARYFAP
jgi:hypothetical protein